MHIVWYLGIGFTLSPLGMVPSPVSAPTSSPVGSGGATQQQRQSSPPDSLGLGQQKSAAAAVAGVMRKVNSPAQLLSNSATAPGNVMQQQQQQQSAVSYTAGGPVGSSAAKPGFSSTSMSPTFKMPSSTATSGLTQHLLHPGSGTSRSKFSRLCYLQVMRDETIQVMTGVCFALLVLLQKAVFLEEGFLGVIGQR